MPDAYVLITAARNEARYIEKTIYSVLSQTILPKRWVIVSDGSTDQTDEIVKRCSLHSDFIQLIRRSADVKRDFGSKVHALNTAFEALAESKYQFLGILDADIVLKPTYYADLMLRFNKNDNLGLAGGVRYDMVGNRFRRIRCDSNSVGGMVQFFRRRCFDQVGCFIPLPYGGEDSVAEITARMHGWQVRSFREIIFYHLRDTGSEGCSVFRACFKNGIRSYIVGYHPLFFLARSVYRTMDHPLYINTVLLMLGYIYAWKSRLPKPLPAATLTYFKKEQIQRLKNMLGIKSAEPNVFNFQGWDHDPNNDSR